MHEDLHPMPLADPYSLPLHLAVVISFQMTALSMLLLLQPPISFWVVLKLLSSLLPRSFLSLSQSSGD